MTGWSNRYFDSQGYISPVHNELLVKCIVIYSFILLEHEDKHKTNFDTRVLIKSKSSEDPDKKKKNDHEIPQSQTDL